MYAVIFKAEIKRLDHEYLATAKHLRNLALNDFGCTGFSTCTEGNREISISYWPSIDHIKKWHRHPEHVKAQTLGKERWYQHYHVQITQLVPTTELRQIA